MFLSEHVFFKLEQSLLEVFFSILKSFLFMGYTMSEDEYTEAVIVLSDYTPAKKEQEASSVIVISDSTTSAVFTPTKR